ncbi:MAG: hypothetical protein EOP00_10660 [Pedobacter sp.]|nr:MAG: hypothetical protein EOP00_10660 [Pedobacter sp.]
MLSETEMSQVKGGLKWTNDRSTNVEDRRGQYGHLYNHLQNLRNRSVGDCLSGYIPPIGPYHLPG